MPVTTAATTKTITPCQRCGSPTVSIDLLDGELRMTMRSCSRCDHRTWTRGSSPAPLPEVLTLVSAGSSKRRTL